MINKWNLSHIKETFKTYKKAQEKIQSVSRE